MGLADGYAAGLHRNAHAWCGISAWEKREDRHLPQPILHAISMPPTSWQTTAEPVAPRAAGSALPFGRPLIHVSNASTVVVRAPPGETAALAAHRPSAELMPWSPIDDSD